MMESALVDSAPVDFLVNRGNLRDCKFVEAQPLASEWLLAGQVLLRPDQFGLTANNITYAVLGEAMGYWKLFPAPEGWGRIPVWGYADVVQSAHPVIQAGDRVYGFLPISTRFVAQLSHVSGETFIDTTDHRRSLPATYNRYTRNAQGRPASASNEDRQTVFRPLFNTAYLLEDFLVEREFFGARQLVIASASSKTALGLASLLSQQRERLVEVIGLTSARHVGFVKGSVFFDRVISYDEIGSLPKLASVFIDMAGNSDVVDAVHLHLASHLVHSSRVGLTHWDKLAPPSKPLPGVQPTLFFAPAQAQKRTEEWGTETFLARCDSAWNRLTELTASCVDIVRLSGPDAVRRVYLDLLEERARPDQAHVLSWSQRRSL